MVALHELLANSRTETQFLQIDYLLLVLSICGFGFVFICLIIVFFNKRNRNQEPNNSTDFEAEARAFISEPKESPLKPPVIALDKEMNNSTVENRQFINKLKAKSSLDNNKNFHQSSFEKTNLNECCGSRNLDSQSNKFTDRFFTLMYPQLSLYNLLHSPKTSPIKKKPTISITEINSEDELNDSKKLKSNLESNDDGVNLDHERETVNQNSRINPFNGKDSFDSDLIDDNMSTKLTTTECNICGINALKNNLNTESPIKDLSNITVDSEEDSDYDITMSESLGSPDSLNIERKKKNKKPTSKMIEVVKSPKKLSQLYSPGNNNIEYIDQQLTMIDEEIKLMPPPNNLDIVDYKAGTEIENQMVARFEILQKDISMFLEQTAKFENPDELFSSLDQENQPSVSRIRENEFENNTGIFTAEYYHRNPHNVFLKSAGDNIHQDRLLVDSSDTNSFSFPYRNIDTDYEPLIQPEIQHSSDSIDYPKNSFVSSSDTVGPMKNLKDHYETDLNFPLDNMKQEIDFKSTELKTDPTTLPSVLNLKPEEIDQIINQNPLENSNTFVNKIDEYEETNNDNNEQIEYEICTTPKNQINDDFRDSSIGLDDSQSSTETYMNKKLVQQTNKNAFSIHDSEHLQVHHFRGGTVQETVKLFENVVGDRKMYDLKSHVKFHNQLS